MKNFLLLGLASALVVSGCSTYKASRTPDDVYYSPAKPAIERQDEDRYESYGNSDDNYLRMKVRNHYQWSGIDDYGYWNDSRYDFGYSCSPSREVMMHPYYGVTVGNPYYLAPWGSWYNPVYTVVYYKSPAVYYKPVSKYTLSTYSNRSYNNYNMPLQTGIRSSAYNNNNYYNSSSNANKTKNSYYNPNQNNSNSSPSRSFNSGSSSMSSGGGSRISGGGSRTRP